MPVVIGLLRGVNVGGKHKIRMDALRELCESIGLKSPKTLIQSGNVVFRTRRRYLSKICREIGDAIEGSHGFRPAVMLRTLAELRAVAGKTPFGAQRELDPAKLAVAFLADKPGATARRSLLTVPRGPEELHVDGRELYIYFPNGMGRSKLQMVKVEKVLATAATARNWNTVRKVLDMAEQMDREQ